MPEGGPYPTPIQGPASVPFGTGTGVRPSGTGREGVVRPLAFAAALLAAAPLGATAQIACLPPEEPYPYEPPRDEPELRALINEQYEAYVLDVEAYLICLRGESDRASREAREVIARWVRHFGDEAALRLPQEDAE